MKHLRTVMWLAYFGIAALAIALQADTRFLAFDGPYAIGKALVFLALGGFVAYSAYCSARENIFRTVGMMMNMHWGRQIVIDLYLGVALFTAMICLHQGALVALLWLVPIIVYANMATLLYLAIHYDAIVAKLASF